MVKIITVVGARPQFVKAAIVSKVFQEYSPSIEESIVHTGQHFDSNMSDVFFEELGISEPHRNLGVGGGTHGQNTGHMIIALEEVFMKEKTDCVLVYGDTDSTLAAALAAAKLNINVVHVEAGLRSFNRRMPEEINRVLTDHVSDVLFAPTQIASDNLVREGISIDKVFQVGDVMFDAALFFSALADQKSQIIDQLSLSPGRYSVATVHRAENTDDECRLKQIFQGFSCSKTPIILPLHPRTKKKMIMYGIEVPSTVRLIEPVGYLDMVMLLKHAKVVFTDSGGVQKEAFFHRIPCLTLRSETEWTELLEVGVNRLVDLGSFDAEVNSIPEMPSNVKDLYGKGDSAQKITETLLSLLK